jgi:hypothetical protein
LSIEAWDGERRRKGRSRIAAAIVVVTSPVVVTTSVIIVSATIIVISTVVIGVRAVTLVVVGVVITASTTSTATETAASVLLTANMRFIVFIEHFGRKHKAIEEDRLVCVLSFELRHFIV